MGFLVGLLDRGRALPDPDPFPLTSFTDSRLRMSLGRVGGASRRAGNSSLHNERTLCTRQVISNPGGGRNSDTYQHEPSSSEQCIGYADNQAFQASGGDVDPCLSPEHGDRRKGESRQEGDAAG